MFYLYLKTHNTTGLNYLGQTVKDPFVYQGSGIYWTNHIKKHGQDITTVVLYETPYREELSEMGLYYSKLWDIVDSKEFANLVAEGGNGGGEFSDDARRRLGWAKGKELSKTHRENIGKAITGRIPTWSQKPIVDEFGNKFSSTNEYNDYRRERGLIRTTRKVISPDGTIYDNMSQAGKAVGISYQAISYRIQTKKYGWRYAPQP